jgi:hypothetical protein
MGRGQTRVNKVIAVLGQISLQEFPEILGHFFPNPRVFRFEFTSEQLASKLQKRR